MAVNSAPFAWTFDCFRRSTLPAMPKVKPLDERLRGAAIVKMSFRLRDQETSPAFTSLYPGLLRDLSLSDAEVEAYIDAHRDELTRAARGTVDDDELN